MIFVECNPDKSLATFLTGLSKKHIIHELRGKGEICNKLRKVNNRIGLIDEDPGKPQPSYVREATLQEDSRDLGLKVLCHKSTGNYLIVLSPDLEEWVLGAVKEAKVDLRLYGLPNDARKLHQTINLNLDKYEKLLNDLRDSARLRELRGLLHRYHSRE